MIISMNSEQTFGKQWQIHRMRMNLSLMMTM